MGRKNNKKKQMSKNKAKKASDGFQKSEYSIDQLLDKAEECVDTFQFELAERFCQRALQQDAENLRALEMSGILMLELGILDKAKTLFSKAIQLSPESGHEKYMYMGQIHTGSEAVEYFMKGIELMKKYMVDMAAQAEEMAASAEDTQLTVSAMDVSTAYCSVAEIYLTDECFEDDAETKCKECLDNAIKECSENPEAHHLFASYWLSKNERDKALEEMTKGVNLWLPQWKEASEADREQPSTSTKEEDDVALCPLSYPSRISATKLLIELEQFETANDILELLLDEEDEVVETWYLLGWVNHLQGDDFKNNARYYLGRAQKVAKQTRCEDKQLIQHVNELLEELGGPVGEEEVGVENGEIDIPSDSDEEQNGQESMDQ